MAALTPTTPPTTAAAVRPVTVSFSDAEIDDVKHRLARTDGRIRRRLAIGHRGFGWRMPGPWSTIGSTATTGNASKPSSIGSPTS